MGFPDPSGNCQTLASAELKEPNKPKEFNRLNWPRPFSCRNLLVVEPLHGARKGQTYHH